MTSNVKPVASSKTFNFIASFETIQTKAYKDVHGKNAIGVGNLAGKKKTISVDEAKKLYENQELSIKTALFQSQPDFWNFMNSDQRDAICSLIQNKGMTTLFNKKQILDGQKPVLIYVPKNSIIEQSIQGFQSGQNIQLHKKNLAKQMLAYCHPTMVSQWTWMNGLYERRIIEAALFLGADITGINYVPLKAVKADKQVLRPNRLRFLASDKSQDIQVHEYNLYFKKVEEHVLQAIGMSKNDIQILSQNTFLADQKRRKNNYAAGK